MGRLVIFVLAAIVSVSHSDVPDVTSIYRLPETGVEGGFVVFDDCFAESMSCPWYKSGWAVKNLSDSDVTNIGRNHTVRESEFSQWIALDSNRTVSVAIKPLLPQHTVRVYLMEDGDDDEQMGHTSMLILTLSSDRNYQAYHCQKAQGVGEEVVVGTNSIKIPRKCSQISGIFLKESDKVEQTDVPYWYQIEYNSKTGELAIDAQIGGVSKPLQQSGYRSSVNARYMRVVAEVGAVSYFIPALGLLLKDRNGELISRDIAVTPKASRLCLSIASARNMLSTNLSVTVRAKDGRKIDFQNASLLGIDLSRAWKEIDYWNFVADLKEFENQTVDIQIQASSHKKEHLYISGLTGCKGIGGARQMTVIHQTASLEVHGSDAAEGAPFILPNNRVIGANVGVPNGCMATRDGCDGWTGIGTASGTWIRKRGSQGEKPHLRIGLERFSESFADMMTPGRDFVDAVEVSLQGLSEAGEPGQRLLDYFRVVLLDIEDNPSGSSIYVLAIDLDEEKTPEKPVLHKCGTNGGSDPVRLTTSVIRQDCKILTKGTLPSSLNLAMAEEFKLQVMIVQEDGQEEQEIKVVFYENSAIDGRTVLVHKDPSPTKVANYRLSSAAKDYVYTASYGVGSLYFSLNSSTTAVTSPKFPIPENRNICLALDYLVDGKKDDDLLTVKVAKSDGIEVPFTESRIEIKTGTRVHVKVTGKIAAPGDVVNVTVALKKPSGRFLLQRLAFCHHEDDTALTIYTNPPEGRLVSIFHPGAQIAIESHEEEDYSGVRAACQNGGEQYETFGCDCPAGFMGKKCETGCGPNRYGAACQGICSFTTRGCRGMLLGRPYLGFNCAPGFGGPLCDLPCEAQSRYGAGCLQKCGKCAEDPNCDVFTGDCLHGCQPGLMPPGCKQEFVYLTSRPKVEKISKDTAELEVDFQNTTGEGLAKYWQIQYRLTGAKDEWIEGEKMNLSSSETTTEKQMLKDLVPGKKYLARVVLLSKDVGQNYQGDKIPVTSFTTTCDEPKSAEYKLTASPFPKGVGLHITWQYGSDTRSCSIVAYEVHVRGGWRWNVYRYPVDALPRPEVKITDLLAGKTYRVRMRAVTASLAAPFSEIVRATVGGSTSPSHVVNLRVKLRTENNAVAVVWAPPRFAPNDFLKEYNVTYQCVSLLACPELACEDKGNETVDLAPTAYTFNLTKLLPHARYRVRVRAISRGQDGADHPGPDASVVFVTPSTSTMAKVTWLEQNAALNTETSVTVAWSPPDADNCPGMHGVFLSYRCEIQPQPDEGGWWLETRNTYVTFSGLAASTKYAVKVFVRTDAGVNATNFIEFNAETQSPGPGAVKNLAVYSKSHSMLGVRWRSPMWQDKSNYRDVPDVDIDHYVVECVASDGDDDGDVVPHTVRVDERCKAWPDQNCRQISGLKKNKDYRVTVYAISKDGKKGKQESTSSTAREEAPEAPLNLRMTDRTKTSISLTWEIPNLINGVLRRFSILAGRDKDEDPEIDKMVEVSDLGEIPFYTHTLTQLEENSQYWVSLKARTKSDGVAANGTFWTKQ